ncbi:MAG: TfoX/Sxy family protein [candidate division WOR-3 bacterium]|nr:MAG: TfoX/Sxy family protein [candidate division WOR-3 bacterium]
MKWRKPSDRLNLFLKEQLKNVDCQSRVMFGCPSYFIKGNMFIGAFGAEIFLRLPPEDIEETLKRFPKASRFEPMPGRVMKQYVALPESIYKKKNIFSELLKKSITYVRSLPLKKKRSKR